MFYVLLHTRHLKSQEKKLYLRQSNTQACKRKKYFFNICRSTLLKRKTRSNISDKTIHTYFKIIYNLNSVQLKNYIMHMYFHRNWSSLIFQIDKTPIHTIFTTLISKNVTRRSLRSNNTSSDDALQFNK